MPKLNVNALTKPARAAHDAWVKSVDEWEEPRDEKGNVRLTMADYFPGQFAPPPTGAETLQRTFDTFVHRAGQLLEIRPGNTNEFTPERAVLFIEMIDQAIGYVVNAQARAAALAQQEWEDAERAKEAAKQSAATGIFNRLMSRELST
jgi:hypothetical protein